MTEDSLTLDEFAAQQVAGRKCWTCNLPDALREQIDAAKGRYTVKTMVAFLHRKGQQEASAGRLNFHFHAGHHE